MAKILVVDDSPVVVASLRAALTQEGFDVLTAADGVDAIQQAYAQQPDLIVLDVMMPRMNGYQTCRLLKAEAATRRIPVIFLTTQSAKHQMFWGAQAGGEAYLVKDRTAYAPPSHLAKEEGWPSIVDAIKRSLDGRAPAAVAQGDSGGTVDVLTRLNALLDEQLFESTLVNQIAAALVQLADYRTVVRDLFAALGRVIDFDTIGLLILGAKQGYCTIGGANTAPATVARYRDALLEQLMAHQPAGLLLPPLLTEVVAPAPGRPPEGTGTPQENGPWPSWVALPLRSRGAVIGLLAMASRRSGAFGPEIERILQSVAHPLTAVVDNARLHRELGELSAAFQNRAQRLSMLFTLSGRLLAAKRLPDLFAEILQGCFKAIQADAGSLMLVEPGRRLRVAAARGLNRRFTKGLSLMIGDRVAGWVAKHRKPQLLVGGLEQHRQFAHLQGRAEIKSSLVVPMLVKRKLIGVLNLNRTTSATRFTQEDIELAATLANHAAVVVEQMRLRQQLETSYAEVQQVKSQLIQSEKLAALGNLASAMAHEIDNPLAIISGIAQLLMDDVRDHPAWADQLRRIVAQTDRASDIIERLLKFAKPAHGRTELVDVNAMINEALQLVQRQLTYEKIELVLALAEGLPPVRGNANQLQEVFLNLIINAYDAMRDGGTLRIETLHEPKTGQVAVRFGDTGAGIPPEAQPRVFEPFFTTKEHGKGLGLFVTHQIIIAHRGSIRLQSRMGRGTTFTIHVPAASAPPASVAEEAPAAQEGQP